MSPKSLLIVNPRGFCAGVERAIEVVDRLLASGGAPLYVRKEIVHNKAVVEDFKARGVVFVEELDEVPDGQTVVFSAHGIAPAVRDEAARRGLRAIDATCPLVTKVHHEVVRHVDRGPPDGADRPRRPRRGAGHHGRGARPHHPGRRASRMWPRCRSPPTPRWPTPPRPPLSVDETAAIVAALRERFANLVEPRQSDICYATQNRQDAVKDLVALGIDHLLVVGSLYSSNSRRLCEVAQNQGVPASLIDGPDDIDPARLGDAQTVGLTAGASAPEHLVQAVVAYLAEHGYQPREVVVSQENVKFQLPRELQDD